MPSYFKDSSSFGWSYFENVTVKEVHDNQEKSD